MLTTAGSTGLTTSRYDVHSAGIALPAGDSSPWAAVGPTYRPTATPPTRHATMSGHRNERVIASTPPMLGVQVGRPGRGAPRRVSPASDRWTPRSGAGRRTLLPIIRGAGDERSCPGPGFAAARRIDSPPTFCYQAP